MKKYILTNEKKEFLGKTLHRIQAIRSFGDVKESEKGGWIEKEENLSHDGNCWVSGDAQIFGAARVSGDAQIFETAQVFGDAQIFGNALVFGDAQIFGNALVFGDAQIFGNAQVFGDVRVFGDAQIFETARVFGAAQIFGNAQIFGDVRVFGDAQIFGNALVCGAAKISSSAIVEKAQDFIYFSPIGSRFDSATFYKTKDKGISVCCGCFRGTIEEFQNQVAETHGSNKFAREYNLAIKLAKIHILEGKNE